MGNLLNECRLKLFIARMIRKYQEDLNEEEASTSTHKNNQLEFPIKMRLISQVIQLTAERLSYDGQVLARLGTTSTNIVYSHVSKIERFIETLIDLSLDPNIKIYITLKPDED